MTIDEKEPKAKQSGKARLSPADELARIPLYEKGKPPQPLFDIDYMDELEATWGRRWGAQTELGKLRSVLVQPPTWGQVASPVIKEDPGFFIFPKGLANLDAMMRNHESLMAILEGAGVELVYLNSPETIKGAYTELTGIDGTREATVLNGGALVGRPATASKRGLERLIAQRLMEIGCPILHMVRGSLFEPGNLVWLDERHAMIGCGVRTGMEGIREVEPVLRMAGVEEIHIAHMPGYLNVQSERAGGPGGFYHLDMVFGMAGEGLAVIYPAGVGYDTIRYLKKKDLDLIEVPLEEVQNYACNLLVIEPGEVVLTEGNPLTRAALEKRGLNVHEVAFEGGRVSGRGPVCKTLPLVRDRGPSI